MSEPAMSEPAPAPTRQELIAVYKSLLRATVEQRPSGLRLKIAEALGTHKSFVSQITNPADPTPLPYRHIPALFEVCQFTAPEQKVFLAAYGAAHPNQIRKLSARRSDRHKILDVEIPVLDNAARQRALEALIRDFARRVAELVDGRNPGADG